MPSIFLEMLFHKIKNYYALSKVMSIEDLAAILKAIHVPVEKAQSLRLIGKGSRAMVFWLPDKKYVLKITRDLDDAQVASNLIGKRMKHLLKVEDVFQRNSVYGIVAEKLTPLAGEDRKQWNLCMKALSKLEIYPSKSAWSLLRTFGLTPQWVGIVKAALQESPSPKIAKAINKVLPVWEAIANELHQIHATNYWDIHDQNVMMRGRNIVLVDFGTAQVANAAPIRSI